MPTVIRAYNLVKKFGSYSAVDSISFQIKEGECFAFLGPNGAGKTTTVKMIHCVSPKTAGELVVLGEEASSDDRKIKGMLGVIPQETNLDKDLTVFENLMIFGSFFDIPKKELKLKVDELLEFVELKDRKKSKIDELSGGMQRRLLIARALINNPKIIIADEPTTGLDPQARHLIWQRLRSLKAKGVTLILTTQYMEEAEQLADRIVIMDKGKILKEGPPLELIRSEIGKEVVEIRISSDFDSQVKAKFDGYYSYAERAGDTLYLYCNEGKAVMQKIVEHRPATLEDLFLKLTGRGLIE